MNRHYDAGAIRALDASEPYDVCIIGSGPAGTILGTSLVERGIRTLILESGTNLFRWLFDRRLRFLSLDLQMLLLKNPLDLPFRSLASSERLRLAAHYC